ncbi:MAG: GNAT family N-acetyltransferase [Saprospiraceae bacterium]|nr:GNAT family N-acetyltransferase [Saprospiraceae bacterium]
MEITALSDNLALMDKAVDFFWSCWGNDDNFKFYRDCITHSVDPGKPLPRFYLGMHDGEIIASYALLTNDIISRQDLYPWLACLFVVPEHRNKGLAARLLQHGLAQAAQKGFEHLYLSTDLEGFYEKNGWSLFGSGFNIFDGEIKIYWKKTRE